jgi:hypothetical protein
VKLRHCLVHACGAVPVALGLCSTHYGRLRRGRPIEEDPEAILEPHRVVVVIPADLHRRIARAASTAETTTSQLIREKLQEAFQ